MTVRSHGGVGEMNRIASVATISLHVAKLGKKSLRDFCGTRLWSVVVRSGLCATVAQAKCLN